MKKKLPVLLIVFLMAFSVVASGCIGGGGGKTTSSPSESSSTSPTTTTTTTPALQAGILEMDKVYVIATDKSVVVVGPKAKTQPSTSPVE